MSDPARLVREVAAGICNAPRNFRPEILEKRRSEFYGFLRHATERWSGETQRS